MVEVELNSLRTENQRLKQQLSIIKHTDQLVQKALGQLEKKCGKSFGINSEKELTDNGKKNNNEEILTGNDKDDEEGNDHPITPSILPTIQNIDEPSTSANSSSDLLLGIASYLFCAVCEKVTVPLKHSHELNRHIIQAHADENKCLACPDEANVLDLESHAKSHTQRFYACEYCGKKGRKHYLKNHVRTHTGEKPYECQSCGRRFADQSTIRRHQVTVHSVEKRYVCPICKRVISRKDNYRVHLRSHRQNEQNDKEKSPEIVEVNEDGDNEIEVTEVGNDK